MNSFRFQHSILIYDCFFPFLSPFKWLIQASTEAASTSSYCLSAPHLRDAISRPDGTLTSET
ncbi:hypothetical protein SDJN02_03889, partial [Cucurbita argyrosperma subsp. argyrosperma]